MWWDISSGPWQCRVCLWFESLSTCLAHFTSSFALNVYRSLMSTGDQWRICFGCLFKLSLFVISGCTMCHGSYVAVYSDLTSCNTLQVMYQFRVVPICFYIDCALKESVWWMFAYPQIVKLAWDWVHLSQICPSLLTKRTLFTGDSKRMKQR